MPNVAPTNHTLEDVQEVRDQAQGLLDKVKTFSFSHEIELLKSKLEEVIGVTGREIERIKSFGHAEAENLNPFKPDVPEAPAAPVAPEQPAQPQPSVDGAMTTQNTITREPQQVPGLTNAEPEHPQA